MQMTLLREWEVLDGCTYDAVACIPAGTHEIECIPNPEGYDGTWLVLKDTLIGASTRSWMQWGMMPEDDTDWGEWRVVITGEPEEIAALRAEVYATETELEDGGA